MGKTYTSRSRVNSLEAAVNIFYYILRYLKIQVVCPLILIRQLQSILTDFIIHSMYFVISVLVEPSKKIQSVEVYY